MTDYGQAALLKSLIQGLSTFLVMYLPMILGFSLIGQQDKIGKTLVAYLRRFIACHLKRLHRLSYEADEVVIFRFFKFKLKPKTRVRKTRPKAAI